MAPGKENDTRYKGRRAEGLVADHLAARGYRIVERNFSCRLGEIDIVAEKGDDLVFVEVRSRGSKSTLNPIYSVNRRKQTKIIRAAQVYLAKNERAPRPARFDVAIVTLGDPPMIEIIPDAFSLTE